MKKTTLITAISIVLATLLIPTAAHAKQKPSSPDITPRTLKQHDQQVPSVGRQRMQLSTRKIAAKRLKALHEQARGQHLQDQINKQSKIRFRKG